MRKLLALASMALLALAMNGCMIWDECTSCQDDSWGWEYDYSYDYGWDVDWNADWNAGWDEGCSCGSSSSCMSSEGSAEIIVEHHEYYEGVGVGSSCVLTRDCSNGLVCFQHRCIAPEDISEPEPVVEPEPDPIVEPEPQVECYSNSDCSGDDICTEGRCIPCQTEKCDTSQEVECVFSTQCDSGLCVNGNCLAAGACVVDANCMEGQICSSGECVARPECLNDAECGEGRICNASGSCEDDVECHVDPDCGEGKICVFNMCAECRLDCECPNEGDVCMNGVCTAG